MLDYTANRVDSFVMVLVCRLVLVLYSKLNQLLLTTQLLLYRAAVVVKQLLWAVEWPAAVVVREYLEVSVDDVVAAIYIDWRVVADNSIGCILIEQPLVVRRIHRQFVLVEVLVQLVIHRVWGLQHLMMVKFWRLSISWASPLAHGLWLLQVEGLRRILAGELFAFVGELIQVQFHQVVNEVTHFLFVVLQSFAVDDLLVFQILQEVS